MSVTLYTAYFDKSDTHRRAPTIIMGAALGSLRQWELYNRGLRRIQSRDEFSIFHATEFKAKSGGILELVGRSEQQLEPFAIILGHIRRF